MVTSYFTELDFQPQKQHKEQLHIRKVVSLSCPYKLRRGLLSSDASRLEFSETKRTMERLPADICLKIFRFLDHQNLATAVQVCRKWKVLASDNMLWSKLFAERWGIDQAAFYAPNPIDSRSWKDVYETQDRGDRVGLGLKIIREGGDYFLVHQGQIQRYLGGSKKRKGVKDCPSSSKPGLKVEETLNVEVPCRGILDKILFFLGDLEAATADAKRGRVL